MRSPTKFSLPFVDISTSFYEFWKFTLFSMNLSIHFWNFGKRKTFPASGPAFGPWPTAPLGQQPVKAPLAGLAAHGPTAQAAWQPNTWACWRAHSRAVTAAAGGAVARAATAHCWARCGSVCRMSTTGVETTRRATRGSVRFTVTVARHEDGEGGPARWRSEAVVMLRGTACGSDMPYVLRKNRG
jgi:hypothetical protein